jgi:hypothetical protein
MVAPRTLRLSIGEKHDRHTFAVIGIKRLRTNEARHRAREPVHLDAQLSVLLFRTGSEAAT